MRNGIESVLEELGTAYRRLKGRGAAGSALIKLGEIHNILRYTEVSDHVAQKWRQFARETPISDEMRDEAVADATKMLSQLKRILSTGTRFEPEELILVITLRLELEILHEFLVERGVAADFAPDSADEEIVRVAPHPESAATFRASVSTTKRNWGVSRRSKWIKNFAS